MINSCQACGSYDNVGRITNLKCDQQLLCDKCLDKINKQKLLRCRLDYDEIINQKSVDDKGVQQSLR